MNIPEPEFGMIEEMFSPHLIKPEVIWKVICDNRRNESNRIKKSLVSNNSKCEVCGYEFAPVLQIHHIVPISQGGDNRSENIVCLCPNCHKTLHYIYRLIRNGDEYANKKIMRYAEEHLTPSQHARLGNLVERYLIMSARHDPTEGELIDAIGYSEN